MQKEPDSSTLICTGAHPEKKAYWKAVQCTAYRLHIYPNTTEQNLAYYQKLMAKLYLFRVKMGQDLPE